MEKSFHKISEESPTVNRILLKILLSIAASQKCVTKTCDVEGAPPQMGQIQNGVFARRLAELDPLRDDVQQLNSLETSDLNQPASIAKKSNETQVKKLARKTRRRLNSIVTSNLREQERWTPAGVANVSHRTLEDLSAAKGQKGTIGNRQ